MIHFNEAFLNRESVRFLLIFFMGICLSPMSMAYQPIGWHWYTVIEKPQTNLKQTLTQSQTLSPVDQINAQKQALDTAKAIAILNPSMDNIKRYLTLQKQAVDEASTFQQNATLTLLFYPELNFVVNHPTQSAAQPIVHALEKEAEVKALADLSNQFFLFFFYRGKDALDQAFAQTVNTLVSHFNFSFLPVSLDGMIDPHFPESVIDHGQAARLKVKTAPALILLNPKQKQVVPFYYGFASLEELEKQALLIESYLKAHVQEENA